MEQEHLRVEQVIWQMEQEHSRMEQAALHQVSMNYMMVLRHIQMVFQVLKMEA